MLLTVYNKVRNKKGQIVQQNAAINFDYVAVLQFSKNGEASQL